MAKSWEDVPVALFEIIHPAARLPTWRTDKSAGADLYTLEDYGLAPGERRALPLGLRVKYPSGHFGLIVPRTSTGLRGIQMYASVCDGDYRGELHACVWNTNSTELYIEKGEPIAQLLFLPYSHPVVLQGYRLNEGLR